MEPWQSMTSEREKAQAERTLQVMAVLEEQWQMPAAEIMSNRTGAGGGLCPE